MEDLPKIFCILCRNNTSKRYFIKSIAGYVFYIEDMEKVLCIKQLPLRADIVGFLLGGNLKTPKRLAMKKKNLHHFSDEN